jgi:hypothetical protein
MNRQFAKQEIKMVGKHMKKGSTSSAMREIKI